VAASVASSSSLQAASYFLRSAVGGRFLFPPAVPGIVDGDPTELALPDKLPYDDDSRCNRTTSALNRSVEDALNRDAAEREFLSDASDSVVGLPLPPPPPPNNSGLRSSL
jgi:hypothetical protein